MKYLIFFLLPLSVFAADIKVPREFTHGHFRLVEGDPGANCVGEGEFAVDDFGGGKVLTFNGRDIMPLAEKNSIYDDISTCQADSETSLSSETTGSVSITMSTEYNRCKDRKRGARMMDTTLIWTVSAKEFLIQHLSIAKSEATSTTTCRYVRR